MSKDLKGLAKHLGIYSIGNIALRAGGFLLLPLYTHYLTLSQYGVLELIYSICSIISSFLGVGLAHATLRFYFEYDDQKERSAVVTTSIISCFLIAVPSLFLISLANPFIAVEFFESADYVMALNLAYIIIVLELGRQIGLAYLRAREYSQLYVVTCFMQLIIQVGCNIYTVAILKKGIEGILVGNGISILCGLAIVMFVIFKECGFRYDLGKLRAMLKYAYPFIFSSLFFVVFKNADRFILKTLLSFEAVGLYGLVQKLGLLLSELIYEPFQKGFGAFRFSIMKKADAASLQALTLKYLIVVLGFAAIGLSLFSHEILRIISEPTYWSASLYMPLVGMSIVLNSCSYVFETGILIKKKTLYLPIIVFASGATGIVLNLVSIKFLGITGACTTLILQAFIYTFLVNHFSQKVYPVNYDWGKIYKIFIIVAVLSSCSYLPFTGNIIVDVLSKSLILLCCPIMMFLSGVLEKEEMRAALFLKKAV